MASADKPFRFPATFTFVVRSFTVLDGIGKGLDPRFDISEIAAPYARGLLLEGNPQYAALAKDFKRRVGLQVWFLKQGSSSRSCLHLMIVGKTSALTMMPHASSYLFMDPACYSYACKVVGLNPTQSNMQPNALHASTLLQSMHASSRRCTA